MYLIRNARIYDPAYRGKGDVLICGGKIEWIAERIPELPVPCTELNGEGMFLVPGLLDCHVHVTGGGGEGGFRTRAPEVAFSDLTMAGVTTVMGLLGTDGLTRSVENLYAKIKALDSEGITAWLFTGSYAAAGPFLTGRADRDIVFVGEVLGRKLALSDHRASQITGQELAEIAAEVRTASMIAGKEGALVLHMGDAETGLEPVREVLEKTSLPVKLFRPTHVNRNPRLLEEGFWLLEKGGYIDLTCGMTGQKNPGDCVQEAKKRGLSTDRITFSSDGQGSWSSYRPDGSLLEMGVSPVDTVYREIRRMVTEMGMKLEEALPFATFNPARAYGLCPRKGCIREGADADILLLDEDLNIRTVIARGQIMVEEGKAVKKGTYER